MDVHSILRELDDIEAKLEERLINGSEWLNKNQNDPRFAKSLSAWLTIMGRFYLLHSIFGEPLENVDWNAYHEWSSVYLDLSEKIDNRIIRVVLHKTGDSSVYEMTVDEFRKFMEMYKNQSSCA